MPVTLTGTGGLFTRIGKIGKALRDINTYQDVTISNFINGVMGQYDTLRDVVVNVPGQQATARSAATQIMSALQTVARETVISMVRADNPIRAKDLGTALTELVQQMRDATQTVQVCTVGATATAGSTNNSDAVVVLSTRRGDGLVQENIIPETGILTVTSDSQTGGASDGSESLQYAGRAASPSVWDFDWAAGSGATTTLTMVDPRIDAGSNILTNSDFETFTSDPPDKWVVAVGTAGVDVKKSTAQKYFGLSSLEIVGGATLSSLYQQFATASTGTASTLTPIRSYAIAFRAKVDVVPAAGVLTVELVDDAGNVIQDSQSTNNAFSVTLSTLTTSWTAHSGVFRMPRVLPSTIRLRIRISTALSAGSSLFLDGLAMTPTTALYTGGPSIAVFAGANKAITNDYWSITTTNNRGGATYNSTFQALFDRLFDMRSLGILLPSAAAPTISDTLITA